MISRKKRAKKHLFNFKKKGSSFFFTGKVVAIFLLVLMVSCQDVKKPERPENLISKDKMSDILYDVYLTNAARSVNNKLLRKTGIKFDSLIYVKYQIDSLQFEKSNAYYSANLKDYSTIIEKVKSRIEKLKDEKDSIYKVIKKIKDDSIIKLNTGVLDKKKKKKDSAKALITPVISN